MINLSKTLLSGSLLGTLALAALAGTAWAGATWPNEVQVWADSAVGSLGSTRNSADNKEYIGCYTYTDGHGYDLGVCMAADMNGKSGYCVFINNPEFTQVLHSLNGDSNLGFGWDKSAYCTFIEVENMSQYEPKKP